MRISIDVLIFKEVFTAQLVLQWSSEESSWKESSQVDVWL
jgi:hypothetical protein